MFTIYKRYISDVEPYEYYPVDEDLTRGCAGFLDEGEIAPCTSGKKPTHIVVGPAKSDGTCPVIPVRSTTVFETSCATALGTSLIGSAVTLNTTHDGVTTTTTSGVFTVEGTENLADGKVYGRFV